MMMREIKVAKYLFFIIAMLFANFAYADMLIDVEASKDPFPFDAMISEDGEIYVSKGSSRISIYESKTEKRLGSICCRKKKNRQDYVYFFGDSKKTARLIYIDIQRLENKKRSIVSLYDVRANLIRSIAYDGEVGDQNIAISKGGRFFSLLLGKNIHVFSSVDFSKVSSFSVKGFEKVSGMSVSEKGDKVAFVSGNKVHAYSYQYSQLQRDLIRGCQDQQGRVQATGFLGEDKKIFYSSSEYGEVCFSLEEKNIFIKLPTGKLYGVFYDDDDNFLFLSSSTGLFLYEVDTEESIGTFLVQPYYEKKFGKNKYEKPFLTSRIKYDSVKNIVLARGSVSTKTLYKIKLMRPIR